jgi:magnesium transporter
VDHLLYLVVDELANGFMAAFTEMDDTLDRIEDELFDRPGPDVLAHLFTIKRALLHLRRIIAPQREVLNKLARDDFEVIDAQQRIFFRDVYDHMVRLYDINESMRDLVSGALDTYLSIVNNRLNDVMKTLTVITTMFMPISFIAGFFGMNFFQPVAPLGAWTDLPIFGGAVTVVVLTPLIMFLWMRRRRWM